MFLVRLLVNSVLLIVVFEESKLYMDLTAWTVNAPKPCIIQESIAYFTLPSISKVLLFQHIISINIINELFYFFLYQIFGIWCVFYTYRTSLSRLTTFQVLKKHIANGYNFG